MESAVEGGWRVTDCEGVGETWGISRAVKTVELLRRSGDRHQATLMRLGGVGRELPGAQQTLDKYRRMNAFGG